jgi:hypothetical protein
VQRYLRMGRTLLLILVLLGCTAGPADARHHGRHHLRLPFGYVVPAEPGGGPYSRQPAAPAPRSEPQSQNLVDLVPSTWRQETSEPNQKGQRFVSPDGTAWFAVSMVPVGQEPIAAHLKATAFVDGEELTYLRGERTWIAVSGLKGDRIFYRAAVLACAGDRWHQVAFEYPAAAKADMRSFVERAAAAVRNSENRACDVPVTP